MKTLVYCHGLLGFSDECPQLLEKLSPKFEIYHFNFSGHGGKLLEKPWSIKQFSKELRNFIENNELQAPTIIGYSLGGFVALRAITDYHIPCRHLYTIGTKWHWDDEVCNREINKINPEILAAKVPQMIEKWSKIHSPNDWRKMIDYCIEFIKKMPNECNFIAEDLQEITTPIDICIGDSDKFVTDSESILIQKMLHKATIKHIENTSHPIEKLNTDYFIEKIMKIT